MYYKNGQQSQAEFLKLSVECSKQPHSTSGALGLSGFYQSIATSSQCSSPTKYGFRPAIDQPPDPHIWLFKNIKKN
jgi:hypothetical protein